MKCKYCGSEDLRIDNCRCQIPCIIFCKACRRRDYDSIPHDRNLKKNGKNPKV
jgi:hypothetical protein